MRQESVIDAMYKVTEQVAHDLRITSFRNDGFTYYCLHTSSYNIFGFRFLPEEEIELRLMEFDDEYLEEESFIADRDSSPCFSFNVLNCKQFLHLLENFVLQKNVIGERNIRQFHKLNLSQLHALHYPLKSASGDWYRYIGLSGIATDDKIRVISLPVWSKKLANNQLSSLWLMTLNQFHLDDDRFNLLLGSKGLGTITITRGALEEIVCMIRETLQILG